MDLDMDLLADLLKAYKAFDHHDPPDPPEDHSGAGTADVLSRPADRLRPADQVAKERLAGAGSETDEAEADEADADAPDADETLKTVYYHVGLLLEGGYLTDPENVYGDLSLAEDHALIPDGDRQVPVLTMQGHQFLDMRGEKTEDENGIGFAA